jgi:hypothetical protein
MKTASGSPKEEFHTDVQWIVFRCWAMPPAAAPRAAAPAAARIRAPSALMGAIETRPQSASSKAERLRPDELPAERHLLVCNAPFGCAGAFVT